MLHFVINVGTRVDRSILLRTMTGEIWRVPSAVFDFCAIPCDSSLELC